MRPVARFLLAALLASAPIAFAIASCGTDAQNIDACRQIEGARCDLAPACRANFDVEACNRFYNDACLSGTGNPDAGEVSALVEPCIAALKACAAADASADLGCPGQALTVGDGGPICADSNGKAIEPTTCNILMQCPEALAACAWVAKPPSTDTDAGDAGDASDAATEAGTGGSGTGGTNAGGSGGTSPG